MTAVAKRQWGPQKTLSEGVSIAIEWLEKAKQKNIMSVQPPTLYQAYVGPYSDAMLAWGKPLSEVFRWSNKDDPTVYRAREAAIRLLAVAFKAHFFLENKDKIAHEPYLFAVPDVANPQKTLYGLMYRLDQSQKTIFVAEGDLGRLTAPQRAIRFPVVLLDGESGQRNRWFYLKYWKTLSEKVVGLQKFSNASAHRKEREQVAAHTDLKTFPFGEIFDIPYEGKELALALGLEWAVGIKKWYLPLGFDLDPVKEYLLYQENIKQK